MKKHLRKISLLGFVLLLSTLVLLPITQAGRGKTDLNQRWSNIPSNAASTLNSASTFTFANTTPISIPGVAGTSSGPASPYPSVIHVSGVSGPPSSVVVKLVGMNHTFPDDLDMLLVSPTGKKLIIWSDAGSGTDLVNRTITIDDSASAALPDTTAIGVGPFRPANYSSGDTFQNVAGPYQSTAPLGTDTLASTFGSDDPNGDWQLYIVDDTAGDAGNVSGGWELTLSSESSVPPPCTITCPANITVGTDPGSCVAMVTYPNATVDGGCGTVTYSHPSGSSFPLGTTAVLVTATQPDATTVTCSFSVTVTDNQPPELTTNLETSSLGPPFNHDFANVGLTSSVSDNCSATGSIRIAVFSNEAEDADDDGVFSPDASDIAVGTLRLRQERLGSGNGRVYLIVASTTDAAGSNHYTCNTVTVPLSSSAAHQKAVEDLAVEALEQCRSTGVAPAGYVAIGNAQASGSKP